MHLPNLCVYQFLLYRTLQCSMVQYSSMQCSIVEGSAVQGSTVQLLFQPMPMGVLRKPAQPKAPFPPIINIVLDSVSASQLLAASCVLELYLFMSWPNPGQVLCSHLVSQASAVNSLASTVNNIFTNSHALKCYEKILQQYIII